MTSRELEKYVGKYVSFVIDELAFLPRPDNVENVDTSCHYEGVLVRNNGSLSHFALDTDFGGIAILNSTIPFIENFVVGKEKLELL